MEPLGLKEDGAHREPHNPQPHSQTLSPLSSSSSHRSSHVRAPLTATEFHRHSTSPPRAAAVAAV
ncbi:hypothetical protein FCV25MIE_13904, partial [Fagus crenata]